MKASRSQAGGWLVLALGLGCGGTDRPEALEPDTTSDVADATNADAGADAGSCPTSDAGRIQVTRRGCPVPLDIGVQ